MLAAIELGPAPLFRVAPWTLSSVRKHLQNQIYNFWRTESFKCIYSYRINMDPVTGNLDTKRTMQDNLKILEKFAKKNGMLGCSQAVQILAKRMHEK